MLNLLKVLHGRRKKVAHLYYFSHIRNELVSYRISLVKSCFCPLSLFSIRIKTIERDGMVSGRFFIK